MKNVPSLLVIAIFLALATQKLNAQNVGVNATGSAPAPSAGLDVDFANKGLLVPRVALTSTTDVATVPAPTTSLLVYNSATAGIFPTNVVPGYYFWDGAKWSRFGVGMINPSSTTSFGKFFVGPFNLPANTNLTLAIADANCTNTSELSVSFAGLLPGSNAQNANIRVYNVQVGPGLWVIQITNLNPAVTYTNLTLSYVAFY